MSWTPVSPDGAVSVKANETNMAANTVYIKTTMGATANDTTNTASIRDHYWDVGANFDGRHRFVCSPAFTISGTASDPVIGTGMDGVTYIREDKVTGTAKELYYQNTVGTKKLSQPFEIVSGGYITAITTAPVLSKSYNVASFSFVSIGIWTVTFSSALADTDYIVTGAMGDTDGRGWTVPNSTKLVGSFNINVQNNSGALKNPTQFYFMVYT
tara:strand:- start:8965 stop:9603 length:639 start_codon:yes stop_codon:yes gene_type:complete